MAAYTAVELALVACMAWRLLVAGALHPAVGWTSLIAAFVVIDVAFCNTAGFGFDGGIDAFFAGLMYMLLLSAASVARLQPIGRRMR